MKLESVDYREFLQKAAHFLLVNKIVVTSVLVLGVGVFVLMHINTLTDPSVDDAHLSEQLESIVEVTFDDEAIKAIEELNSPNIEIESDFTDRDNPFAD